MKTYLTVKVYDAENFPVDETSIPKPKPIDVKKFEIKLDALKELVKVGYLKLGTSYDPIAMDNFISLGDEEFPTLDGNKVIVIQLSGDSSEWSPVISNLFIVCCRVKNVGIDHNSQNFGAPEENWGEIFDLNLNARNLTITPDELLYIGANKNGNCVIATKEKPVNSYLAYSIILCSELPDIKGRSRNFYFLLDPVVRVRSNR